MTPNRYVLYVLVRPPGSYRFQIKEVYDLLSLNYVEDDEAAFRFKYSAEFLEWYTFRFTTAGDESLTPPQGPQTTRLLQGMARWRSSLFE